MCTADDVVDFVSRCKNEIATVTEVLDEYSSDLLARATRERPLMYSPSEELIYHE
jgi:hypothetical protein